MFNRFYIITPCFNYQEYLDKCIESINNQDYPKKFIRMLIIDDNSDIPLKTKEVSFFIKKIRNNERMHPGYNRYLGYKEAYDDDIIVFLDGDDWLIDSKCLSLINKIYNENRIDWSVSNHKIFLENRTKIIPTNVTLPLEFDKPKICHLRCGYGYVWNKIDIDWLMFNKEYIKWMTDWNENVYALKNFGQPYKINSSLCVYNQNTSKTKKENKNYNEMINFFKNKKI